MSADQDAPGQSQQSDQPTVPNADLGSLGVSNNGNGNGQSELRSNTSGLTQIDGAPSGRQMPCNIEAEQSVLGAILMDNEAYFRISDVLSPEHFFDPLHQRIFDTVSAMIRQGHLVTPVTLKSYFEGDAALLQAGGAAYLARLASNAPTLINAPDYARTVFELFQRRGLMRAGDEMAAIAANANVELPPGEQIENAEQRLYDLAESGKYEGGFATFADAAERAVDTANKAYQRDGGLSGVATGLIDLDRLLGGLHASDLIILAGRPSMGKTALATNIAFNAARRLREGQKADGTRETLDGAIVAFYSLEMSAEQLATRLLSEQSRIPSSRLRGGNISDEEFRRFVQAQSELQSLPLYIDDTGGLSMAALAARARRLQRQRGLDLIVVDYLQLVTTSGGRRNDGRVQEVTQVTQGLKALAKELDVPVLALSQLSRKVEDRDDKRPQLADLRESGSIEQDADVVMFVYREEYYLERTKPSDSELAKLVEWQQKMEDVHGVAEIIIGKQRHGPTGTLELQFQAEITRFSNKSKRNYPDTPGAEPHTDADTNVPF